MTVPPNGAADEPPAAEARNADARVGSIRWLRGRERSEREHNQRRSRRAVTRTQSVRVTVRITRRPAAGKSLRQKAG